MQNLTLTGRKSPVAPFAKLEPNASIPHSPRRALGFAFLLLLPLLSGGALAHEGHGSDVPNVFAEKVADANARFADVNAAVAEGYAPIPCVSGQEGGAMGIHYVNQQLIEDPALDVAHPEAVLYEPGADGKLTLVAVEYIVPKGPAALDGQLFSYVGEPNRYGLPAFYELHVWAWRDNPAGAFADMNAEVSCAAVAAE